MCEDNLVTHDKSAPRVVAVVASYSAIYYSSCTYLYSFIVSHKKENSVHKLICVIQIFMRNIFMV